MQPVGFCLRVIWYLFTILMFDLPININFIVIRLRHRHPWAPKFNSSATSSLPCPVLCPSSIHPVRHLTNPGSQSGHPAWGNLILAGSIMMTLSVSGQLYLGMKFPRAVCIRRRQVIHLHELTCNTYPIGHDSDPGTYYSHSIQCIALWKRTSPFLSVPQFSCSPPSSANSTSGVPLLH
ncbi:hypothetical protein BDV59DRAFT_127358 [Aspergillus ambiguus]|uniref:uncharacterized protein n=1 Tax=Aspergillus ambiguus TaxID=176160 RepID=UPI003CCDAA47